MSVGSGGPPLGPCHETRGSDKAICGEVVVMKGGHAGREEPGGMEGNDGLEEGRATLGSASRRKGSSLDNICMPAQEYHWLWVCTSTHA